jgi:hypothetical protein
MANDALEFGIKALVCKMSGKYLYGNKSFPSSREWNIQLEKLERMADAFIRKYSSAAMQSLSAAQLRKRQGADMHRLSHQSKRVDRLQIAVWTEFFLEEYPDSTPRMKKRDFPVSLRKSLKNQNRKIHEVALLARKSLGLPGESRLKWIAEKLQLKD